MEVKFCSQCGGKVTWRTSNDDPHPRYICNNCNFIHYQNPKIVTGCIVYNNDSVLLCRRAIEPRIGLWALPAGFMENGETTRQAAERETLEETGAQIEIENLFAITNSTQAHHVNIFYIAKLKDCNFHPTKESSEVKLFKKHEIFSKDIAFYTVEVVLNLFFNDIDNGFLKVHEIDF